MSAPAAFDQDRQKPVRPGVFLDRDGVLNRAVVRDGRPYPPATLEDLVVLDGAAEACRILAGAGCVLVVVTNQPDVARRLTDARVVDSINNRLRDKLSLYDIRTCPHDDADGCACRKPKPGLLLEASRIHGLDLSRSVMIGDRWRDIEAGKRAGCATVFCDHGYQERRPDAPDLTCGSLLDAVPFILNVIGGNTATVATFSNRKGLP